MLVIGVQCDLTRIAHFSGMIPSASLNLVVLVYCGLSLRLWDDWCFTKHCICIMLVCLIRSWTHDTECCLHWYILVSGKYAAIVSVVIMNVFATWIRSDDRFWFFIQNLLSFLNCLLLRLELWELAHTFVHGDIFTTLVELPLIITRCEHFLSNWSSKFQHDVWGLVDVVALVAIQSFIEVECTLV